MSRRMSRSVPALVLLVAGLLWITTGASGQSAHSTRNGEWPHYTGDLAGTRYSPLDQINADNFNQLEVAWRFKTDNLGTRPEYKLEGTPFQLKVWGEILKIPYGETRTYGEIANAIGEPKSCRAIANACGQNKLALIVPCHRVVGKTNIGGYKWGTHRKKWLLELEKRYKN